MIGVPDPDWGEVIKAIIVPHKGARAGAAGARRVHEVASRELQGADLLRLRRRAAAQPAGQGAEDGAAQAVRHGGERVTRQVHGLQFTVYGLCVWAPN